MRTPFKLKAIEYPLVWPSVTGLFKGAQYVVKTLRQAGFQAFIAGGAVRDALLKREIGEIDIATSARPGQVEELFQKTIPIGKKHGTITVAVAGNFFEVTTFRSEHSFEDFRRPKKVYYIKDPAKDALRRDITINALFYDMGRKIVLDYTGGLKDLRKRIVRMVGEADERIAEDALRMMRAVRFSAVLEFRIERLTKLSIIKRAKLIKKISPERIKQELDLMMRSSNAALGIKLLDELKLLGLILPEVAALRGVKQPKNQHSEGDVFQHTLLALQKFDKWYDLPSRYAVLFHDLGKPLTRSRAKGKTTFYKHQNVGEKMAGDICQRLKFSREDTNKIMWLVRNHHVPYDLPKMKIATRRKWALDKNFLDLLLVYKADAKSSLPPNGRVNPNPTGYRIGLRLIDELKKQPKLSKKIISGNEVMQELGIGPGPKVGQILNKIEEQKLAGKINNKKDAKKFLKKCV